MCFQDATRHPEVREGSLAQAERILEEELRGMGWTSMRLKALGTGDPGKVAIAGRLRRETTVTLKWIAT